MDFGLLDLGLGQISPKLEALSRFFSAVYHPHDAPDEKDILAIIGCVEKMDHELSF